MSSHTLEFVTNAFFELDTHKKNKEVPRVIYGNIFLKHLNLSISFAQFPLQYDQYFPSFSYFVGLLYEPLGE